MFRSLRPILISLLAVGLLYTAYALVLLPFIEPPPPARRMSEELPPNYSAVTEHTALAELFPADAWERQQPKIVETDQGLLLIRDYVPTADGKLELKPCTLILYSARNGGDRKGKRPMVMQAPEGAVLQFDRAFDLRRADIGKLVGGRLAGEIKIWARESRPGAGDDLDLVTRNVQLDSQRIWTPHEVRFRFGRSYGSGRDLTALLLRDDDSSGSATASRAKGIKSLELVHVDRVHLDFGDKANSSDMFAMLGGGKKPALATPEKIGPVSERPDYTEERPGYTKENPGVDITCEGSFQYDFLANVASFEKNVVVGRRPLPGKSPDELRCQLLEAHFHVAAKGEENTTPPVDAKTAPAPTGKKPSQGLAKIVALGMPVTLDAPTYAASLFASRLEYDVDARRIRLTHDQRVTLRRDRQRIEAQQLQYEMPAEGALGELWAVGPGEFTGPLRAGDKEELSAKWTKSLHLRPHEGQHVLSLDAGASIALPGMGRLSAQQIHLWLRQILLPAAATSDPKNPPSADKAARTTILPEKLLATNSVQLEAPQFSADTKRLEMWINNGLPAAPTQLTPIPPVVGQGADARRSPEERTSVRRVTYMPVVPAKPAEKVYLQGELIRVQLTAAQAAYELSEATVTQGVRLTQPPSVPGKTGLTILGDALYLRRTGPTATEVRVVGQPAQVMAEGMALQGTNVQFDQQQNHVWMEGPGEMKLPLAARAFAGIGSPPAGAIERPSTPTPEKPPELAQLTWQQRLDFNGDTLRFLGDVNLRTTAQHARADALDAILSRGVNFAAAGGALPGIGANPTAAVTPAAPAPGGAAPQLRSVILRGTVRIENRTGDVPGQVASVDRLEAAEVRLDQQSGDFTAVGPGFVRTVRRGAPVAEKLGGAAPAGDKLLFLQVNFQRGIAGQMQRREIKFLERVQCVYGPVLKWDDVLRGDSVEALGPEGALLHCDQLTIAQLGLLGTAQHPVEMLAEGNALIEAQSFTARAHRVAYAQLKDQLVLEGAGRTDAELRRQTKPGAPVSYAAARKIMFWRKDNRVEVEDARFFDLDQIGNLPGTPR